MISSGARQWRDGRGGGDISIDIAYRKTADSV